MHFGTAFVLPTIPAWVVHGPKLLKAHVVFCRVEFQVSLIRFISVALTSAEGLDDSKVCACKQ